MRVEFPETDIPSTTATATVAEGGWHPATGGPNGRWPDGDVALLDLDPPRPQARAAPLSLAVPRGRRVWMCGYPQHQDAGSGVTARIQNAHGRAYFQLTPLDPSEAIRPGFSGSAVIDAAGLHEHHGSAPQSIVLGMVVGRYDDPAQVPPEERQRHGYMIPTDRIVALLPAVGEYVLGAPARDTSLGIRPPVDPQQASGADPELARELADWLCQEPVRPRPDVLLVATVGDERRDVAVRESLDGADLALDAAGLSARELIGTLVQRLGLPEVHQAELQRWLIDGRGTPPGLPAEEDDGRHHPAIRSPLTVAVHGVDNAGEPHELVDLLVRLRETGCRVLAVCRHDSDIVWHQAARDLLAPALRETASQLIDMLDGLEHDARHRPKGPGVIPVPEVMPDRVLRLALLRNEPHPDLQSRELRALVGQLYADIGRHVTGPERDAQPWGRP